LFLIIPLTLLLASVIGISVIVFRKMPYLNKLTPETHLSAQAGAGEQILTDLFPELLEGVKSLKLKEYGNLWLTEVEKLLRRLRVMSLKMDRISDSWIKKIRRGNSLRTRTSVVAEKIEDAINPISKTQPVPKITLEEMKREEQGLIIEIAKNPKDYKQYETLGDLYVKMNNLSDAKESFEAAIELNPLNEELQKKHSRVLKKMLV